MVYTSLVYHGGYTRLYTPPRVYHGVFQAIYHLGYTTGCTRLCYLGYTTGYTCLVPYGVYHRVYMPGTVQGVPQEKQGELCAERISS